MTAEKTHTQIYESIPIRLSLPIPLQTHAITYSDQYSHRPTCAHTHRRTHTSTRCVHIPSALSEHMQSTHACAVKIMQESPALVSLDREEQRKKQRTYYTIADTHLYPFTQSTYVQQLCASICSRCPDICSRHASKIVHDDGTLCWFRNQHGASTSPLNPATDMLLLVTCDVQTGSHGHLGAQHETQYLILTPT